MNDPTQAASSSRPREFLFVNHHSTSLPTLPGRRHNTTVASHVQTWRLNDPLPSSIPPEGEVKRKNRDQSAIVSKWRIHPLTILQKGNSDPFEAVAIQITPQANEAIAFGNGYLLPAMFRASTNNSSRSRRIVRKGVSQLSDEGTALGMISFYATAMAVVAQTKPSNDLALKYQALCVASLRQHLLNAESTKINQHVSQILRLFCCEVLKRDLTAAKVHSSILRRIFEDSPEPGAADVVNLSYALYHDTNLSAMFMVRPSFDVEDSVPSILQPYWNKAIAQVPYLSSNAPGQPDPFLGQQVRFRELLWDVRRHLHSWTLIQDLQEIQAPLVFWSVPLSCVNECRLINYYLDLKEGRWLESVCASDRWPQAFTCLAALYLDHCLRYNPIINDVVLYDTTTAIMVNLKKAIIQAAKFATLESRLKWQNALLWTLYVGASAERAPNITAISSKWFNARFRTQATDMGLSKWDDIRAILMTFPYTPYVSPAGETWVEDQMRVS